MRRITLGLLALSTTALIGCSSGHHTAQPSASASPIVTTLIVGKGDQQLSAGVYRSPAGFEPPVTITARAGWTSIHRGVDGFDFGLAGTGGAAPSVAVVIIVPPESTAAAALAAARARAHGKLTPVSTPLLGHNAAGFQVDAGSGSVVKSRAGTIGLDAPSHGKLRVFGLDSGGKPLLVAIYQPVAADGALNLLNADVLISGIAVAR